MNPRVIFLPFKTTYNLQTKITSFFREKLSIAFLLVTFVVPQVFAQKLPFKNFTTNEGLSTNKIISVFQKKNNELWLGSAEGINIYDGNSFHSANSLFKLPHRTVYDITEINGKTFISTNGGLCIYDGKDTVVYNTNNGLKHNRVYKTYKDRDGVIWVATQNGVHIFKNKITNIDIHPLINDSAIYNIYEDKKGALWFCSITSGVIRYYKNETKQFLNIEYPHSFVGSVLQKNDSTFWVAARSGVYSIINNKTKRLNLGAVKNTNFYEIKQSHTGDIWIGSTDGVFVHRDNKFHQYTTANGLVNNTIFKIFEDNEKTLWFASPEKGVSQLINEKLILYDKATIYHPNVTSIIPKNDSVLYLGSKTGIVMFNRFSHESDTLPLPQYTYYNGYYNNSKKQLVIGSSYGTYIIKDDNTYNTIHSISSEGSLRKCWTVARDNNNKLWFGTSEGVGHLKDSSISFYKSDENYHEFVLDIEKDQNGKMWFATEYGLAYLEGEKIINYSKKHDFHRTRIRQITKDQNGLLWFVGDKGLYKQVGDVFHEVPYQHIKNESIQSIAFDSQNNLWAGLPNGILHFKNEQSEIVFYSKTEGFLGKECNISANYVSPEGDVYFGTDNGLVKYQSAHDKEQFITPIINLNMKVLGIDNLSEYSDSITPLGLPVQLNLPLNNNQITFSFKVISLLYGKSIKFQHQLVGFEKQWKISDNDSEIEFNELPFGAYTFKIKILDHPNLHPSKELEIHFVIEKPFYLQTWFIFICAIIILSWIYSYYLIKKNVNLLNQQQSIILSQKHSVEKANKEIVDSITYAKRIQDAILPNNQFLNSVFKEYFILYQPCNIVSGDFYWVEKLGDEIVFAAADCTGHGVPGAMVSLMCSNLLRQVILEEQCNDPGKVLDEVSKALLKRLEGNNETVADGMDISLCFWNPITNSLKFAGANNPLYLIRNNELLITKADKQPIGYFEDRIPFTTHQLELISGDQIILFSDGFKDQFGGLKNKKFSSKRFKNILVENSSLDLKNQKTALSEAFSTWKGDEEQIDDICVFGVKIQ